MHTAATTNIRQISGPVKKFTKADHVVRGAAKNSTVEVADIKPKKISQATVICRV